MFLFKKIKDMKIWIHILLDTMEGNGIQDIYYLRIHISVIFWYKSFLCSRNIFENVNIFEYFSIKREQLNISFTLFFWCTQRKICAYEFLCYT